MGYACLFVLIATCRRDGWPYHAVSLRWCAGCWVSPQLLSSPSSAGPSRKLHTTHSSEAHYRTCLHCLFWLTPLWSCHNKNSCMRSPWQQSARISWKWRNLNVRNSLQADADARTELWLRTDSFMDRFHTLFMFLLEVFAGFTRRWAHLCLTNVIVLHAQSYRACFEDFPWPQLWSTGVSSLCVNVEKMCLKRSETLRAVFR